jgi:thiamine kinase-like enzyme
VSDVVHAVVERLWPGRTRRVERLDGGITNANFKVEVGDECVVVRVPGARTDLLGIDRPSEAAATRLAAAIGVGPEVVAVVEDPWCLVTRFIEGRPIAPAELTAEPMLGRLAGTLRKVHGAGSIPFTFDYFAVIRRYHAAALRRGVVEPFDYAGARAVVDRIARARPFRATVLGHNDLLNANFLYDGEVRILDWEYAGMTDPFFDLANLSVNHDFPPGRDDALLGHYFGHCDDGLRAVLALMKLVSELREAMWGVLQMAISDLDVDYAAYAAQRATHFEALAAGDLADILASAAACTG